MEAGRREHSKMGLIFETLVPNLDKMQEKMEKSKG